MAQRAAPLAAAAVCRISRRLFQAATKSRWSSSGSATAAPIACSSAMPTPRKERFLAQYRDALEVPFIMGVGGGFDVLAGHVKRAPRSMQRAASNGSTASARSRGACGGAMPQPTRLMPRLLGKELVKRAMGRPSGPQHQ